MTDLTTSEVSSRVYNTRPSKQQDYKPFRGHEESDAGNSHPSTDAETTETSVRPSRIASPEVRAVSPDQKKKPAKMLKPVDEAKKLLSKIDNKLQMRIERAEQAQALAALLAKLRKLFSVDNDVLAIMLKHDTMAILLSTSEFICRFEFLTEETLQCLTPLTRSPELRNAAMDMALSNGGLILCLCALRYYKHNSSIRTMAVELLSRCIEIVEEGSKNRQTPSTKKYLSDSYISHQLLLHGAASSFPAVLCLFVQADAEIGTKRLLKCLITDYTTLSFDDSFIGVKYLLLQTPADMATNIAMAGRWSAVRDCIWVLRKMSPELQATAAVVLTGSGQASIWVVLPLSDSILCVYSAGWWRAVPWSRRRCWICGAGTT
jgi:hypothetical protein